MPFPKHLMLTTQSFLRLYDFHTAFTSLCWCGPTSRGSRFNGAPHISLDPLKLTWNTEKRPPFCILSAWARWRALFVSLFLQNSGCWFCWQLVEPACSLRCICSSTRAFVSARTKPQQHQWQQRPATKPAVHQHYSTNLSEASPFLFAFLAVVRLWYLASYLSHSPSVSAPLAPPTSIKFYLLCASCSYVVALLYGFASYSVIKAPLCAQPRTAVFWVKGVPVGAPGPSQRGFGLCGYVIMRISLVSICLCCCFLV